MTSAPHWRAMTPADLDAVVRISDAVHGRYSETRATYAERLALYPDGCRMLERDGVPTGYLITHPWGTVPPKLDERLGRLPDRPATYYLHDIALLPAARGSGAGATATAFVRDHAHSAGFRDITLCAVNGADRFWAAQGFLYSPGAEHPYGEGTFLMHLPLDAGR